MTSSSSILSQASITGAAPGGESEEAVWACLNAERGCGDVVEISGQRDRLLEVRNAMLENGGLSSIAKSVAEGQERYVVMTETNMREIRRR